MLVVVGILTTVGVTSMLAGELARPVFSTAIHLVFVVPVLAAAWALGIALTVPFARRGCFESSVWPAGFRSLIALALGIGVFALTMLLFGTLGFVERGGNSWYPALIPAAGAVAGLFPALRFLQGPREPFLRRKAHRGDWLLLVAPAPIAIMIIAATVPPDTVWIRESKGYDAMEYHLELPREYALRNSTAPVSHNVYSYLPANVEMLYLLQQQLAKTMLTNEPRVGYLWGTLPAQFLHVLLTLLTAGAIAVMPLGSKEKPFLTATGRGVSILLFLGAPWVIMTGSLAYNEMGMMLFGTLAMGAACGWTRGNSAVPQGVLAGLLLGLAMGCKLTAGLFFGVPVALIFLSRALTDGTHARALAFAVLFAAVVYSPWAVRAAVYSGGNPLFPLATSILPRNDWTAEQAARFDRGHQAREDQRSIPGRLTALVESTVFDGGYSVQPYALLHLLEDPPAERDAWWKRLGLLWLALPAAVACAFIPREGRGEGSLLLGVFLVQVVAWLFFTHLQGRFLLPALVPLALLAGRGIQGIRTAENIPIGALRIAGGTLVVIHALSTIFLLLPEIGVFGGPRARSPQAPPLNIGDPFSQVFHIATEWENVANEGGELDGRGGLLLVGEARAWSFAGKVQYYTAFDSHPFAAALKQSPQAALEWLKANDIEFILFNPAEQDRLRKTYGLQEDIPHPALSALTQLGAKEVRVEARNGELFLLRVPR